MRREWIEIIADEMYNLVDGQSPSMRREWIEMLGYEKRNRRTKRSPSMRREWIEIHAVGYAANFQYVSLHAEGVD